MTDFTCTEARDLVAEYSLGILEPALTRRMSEHIAGCMACRHEVDETEGVGDQLLDLIPDAEPPLGFDRAVIAAIGQRPDRRRRHRVFAGVGALAAAVAAVVGVAVTTLTGQHHVRSLELTAVFFQGDRPVGTVYIGGHPAWVNMSVDHAKLTGMVACQLISRNGSVTTIGDFQLVDGSGKWSAPDPAANPQIVGARLIAPDGTVMATASFTATHADEANWR